jgi:hypothetical protein
LVAINLQLDFTSRLFSKSQQRLGHFHLTVSYPVMANDPAPPARSGLSLYANLLDPQSSTPGSISSAPVSYQQQDAEQDEAAKKQQSLAGT